MANFFDTPDPCQTTAKPPTFNPVASWLTPAERNNYVEQEEEQEEKQVENQERENPLETEAPPGEPIPDGWSDFWMNSEKVGPKQEVLDHGDVLRLMEALKFLGYYNDCEEYAKLQNWCEPQSPGGKEFPVLWNALRAFQTQNKLVLRSGAPIRDGACNNGAITFKKLNQKILEKRDGIPAIQAELSRRKEEAACEKGQEILDQKLSDRGNAEDGEVSPIETRLVEGLKESFSLELGVFQSYIMELTAQKGKENAEWDVTQLVSIMVHQLNSEGWFTQKGKKDEEYQAKVGYLRDFFVNAAFGDSENAELYKGEAVFLERFAETDHVNLEYYVWAEEQSAVETLVDYLPRLTELRCLANPETEDPGELQKARQANQKYQNLIDQLGHAQILDKAIYSEKLLCHQTPENESVIQDLASAPMPTGDPVGNAIRKDFEVRLLQNIALLDETKRDYILNWMAKGDRNSDLAKLVNRNRSAIAKTDGLGEKALAHLDKTLRNPSKTLLDQNLGDPEKILSLYPGDKERFTFLQSRLEKDPQLIVRILDRLPGQEAGELSFKLLMDKAEGDAISNLQSPLVRAFRDKIAAGRDCWWNAEQTKHFPWYLSRLEKLSGQLPDESRGQKGDKAGARQTGAEMKYSGYWVDKNNNGNPAVIAGSIGAKLPVDPNAFRLMLRGQRELKGAEYEKEIFHRTLVQAMVEERIWDWEDGLLNEIAGMASEFGLCELQDTLLSVKLVRGQQERDKQKMGYGRLEEEEQHTESRISDFEAQRKSIQEELNSMAKVKPPVERGLAGFASEGNSFEDTETVHWPGGASGVTLGKGLDFKLISDEEFDLLLKHGVPEVYVEALSKARGLSGESGGPESLGKPLSAEGFVKNFRKKYPEFKMTADQQTAIYKEVYANREKNAAWRLMNPHKVTSLPAESGISQDQYDALPDDIKQFFGDLRFQGVLAENSEYKMAEMLSIIKDSKSAGEIREKLIAKCRILMEKGTYPRRATFRWLLLTGRIIHFEAADAVCDWKKNGHASPEDAYEKWKKKAGEGKSSFSVEISANTSEESGNEEKPNEKVDSAEEPNLTQMSDEEFIEWYMGHPLSEQELEEAKTENLQFSLALQKKRKLDQDKKKARLADLDRQIAEEQEILANIRKQKEELDDQLKAGELELVDGYLKNGALLVQAHTSEGKVDTDTLANVMAQTAIIEPDSVGQVVRSMPDVTSAQRFLTSLVSEWEMQGILPFVPPQLKSQILYGMDGTSETVERLLNAEGTAEKSVKDHTELREQSLSRAPGFIYGPWLSGWEDYFTQTRPEDRGKDEKGRTVKGITPEEADRFGYGGSCGVASKKMMREKGFAPIQSTKERYGVIDGNTGKLASTVRAAIEVLDNNLKNRMPAFVGVDTGEVRNDYSMAEGVLTSSDHFIVVVGKGKDEKGVFYAYLDPGRFGKEGFDLDKNRLYWNEEKKNYYHSPYKKKNGELREYSLAEVRKTKKIR